MREGSSEVVTISEIDAPIMRDVLGYLYEMQLEANAESLAAVLRAANRLEISSLLRRSGDFLIATLTPETCVASWNVAHAPAHPERDALRVREQP